MKTILGLIILVMGHSAFANDFAATFGLRSNSADAVATGFSSTGKTSYGFGVTGFIDINETMQFRSGFLYNQRSYKISATGVDAELNLTYVDIPVTVMYKFADYAGAFFGPVVSLLASKECKISTGASCGKDPESFTLAYELGVMFKFAPQMGAELYYEIIPTEFWKDNLKNSKVVGANFLYTFE